MAGIPTEHPDRAMARLAGRQHGLATREQLLSAGLRAGAITRRIAAGRLHPKHAGIYAVGHLAPTPLARPLAAVLACGPDAVLSCRDAAVLWDLLPASSAPVHVSRVGPRRLERPGITLHRVLCLPAGDVTRRHGIPVTAPARTLLDLAATADERDLGKAVEEAVRRGLVGPEALLARAPGRPGARALRRLLAGGPTFTRSEAERRLQRLIRRAGLPRPRTNIVLAGHEVDALWPAARLVIEVDGYAFHGSRAAFERDRLRDADLLAAGYRVLRVTWRQLDEQPEALVARLAVALTPAPELRAA